MKIRVPLVREILRQFHLLWNFVVLVYRRFKEERCFQLCGSLTFTSLLALVPLVTITATMMAAFPVFDGIIEVLKKYVTANLVPAASSKVITLYMQQFADNAARLTALGIVLLVGTAIMMMLTIDRAFNTIWRARRPRPLIQRILIYWSVLTIGPILIGGSLSVTSWLVSYSLGFERASSPMMIVALKISPLLMTSIAFAFLYRTVPNRQVTLLDAAVGGVIAAMAFEGMKNVFGNFIANFANYKLIYGTFASLPILLIWIYLSWVVLVFAAVITAVLPYWRTGGVQLNRAVGNQFVDAVEILRLLYRAYLDGNVLNLQQMRVALRLSWEETELILDKLEAAGWVAKLQGNGWTLVRDVERIRMKEIFRVFVLSKDAAENSQENTVKRLVASVMQGVDGELDMTLKELFGTSIARPARAA